MLVLLILPSDFLSNLVRITYFVILYRQSNHINSRTHNRLVAGSRHARHILPVLRLISTILYKIPQKQILFKHRIREYSISIFIIVSYLNMINQYNYLSTKRCFVYPCTKRRKTRNPCKKVTLCALTVKVDGYSIGYGL